MISLFHSDELDYFKIPGPQEYKIPSFQNKFSLSVKKVESCKKKCKLIENVQALPSSNNYPFQIKQSCSYSFGKFQRSSAVKQEIIPGVGQYNIYSGNIKSGFSFGRELHSGFWNFNQLQQLQLTKTKRSKIQSYYDKQKKPKTKQSKTLSYSDQQKSKNVKQSLLVNNVQLELRNPYDKKKKFINLNKTIKQNILNIDYKEVGFVGGWSKGKKVGSWELLLKEETYYEWIGGGKYNENGIKIGNGLNYAKNNLKLLTSKGLYENNKKIANVLEKTIEIYINVLLSENSRGNSKFDEYENEKKIGRWVELDEKFDNLRQVTYNGEYNMNKIKVGRWDIMYCKYDEKEYKLINISNLKLQINIVVVDHMIKKEIRKRLESGQNCLKDFGIMLKSLLMENII